MPRKLLVGGPPTSGSLRGVTVKKVSPPTVPALSLSLPNHKRHSNGSNPCIVYKSDLLEEVNPEPEYGFRKKSNSTSGAYPKKGAFVFHHHQQQNLSFLKRMSGSRTGSNGQIHLAHVTVHTQPDSLPSTPLEPLTTPNLLKGRQMSGTQVSLEDQGIDVGSPGGRHSPGGSSGGSSVSRNSLSSLDSGRASAPGGSKVPIKRRLSVQSCSEGGFANQRSSYHSSSSSIASSGDDHQCTAGSVLGPNVAEMVLHGLPDVEVLNSWLVSLHFEEYTSLFLQAGYDMPTITRMTPEDLTAIGITKPNHRRKMKAEIAKLNISDGIPEYKPNTLLEWLKLLRLEEYYATLCQQKYDTIDRVTELTWEDLEDIGISKLGHQKKILLAIKRVEDINQGRRPNIFPQTLQQMHTPPPNCNYSNYARPSALSTTQPFAYPAEEVAIATHRSKNSPSTDSIPEMKTFLQPESIAEDGTCPPTKSSGNGQFAPTHNHNGTVNPALSPCRGKSLESLHPEEQLSSVVPLIHHHPVTFFNSTPVAPPDRPKLHATKDWKTTDLDSAEYSYECDGTATLNRPKGLVKLRPVAKVSAKTREEIAEIITDIPDDDFKNLISQGGTLDGWSSLDGSPRRGSSSSSTVPRASTMRRPPPPPPPKRNNSKKDDKPTTEELSRKKEDLPPPPPTRRKPSNLTNVQQKTQTVVQDTPKQDELHEEEFPPPPSPLLSAVEAEKSLANSSPETKPEGLEELFNNPLFRQKRKDSASSVDASALLPLVSEGNSNAKEDSPKQFPSLPIEVSLRSTSKDRNLNRNISQTDRQHEYEHTSEAMLSPGDVIDDIEHMLANLSDQLDAMLDEDQVPKK